MPPLAVEEDDGVYLGATQSGERLEEGADQRGLADAGHPDDRQHPSIVIGEKFHQHVAFDGAVDEFSRRGAGQLVDQERRVA
jgi:hypothetical protein